MTLQQALQETGDFYQDNLTWIQVFYTDPLHLYYHLEDFVVSSHVSGPALVLIRRTNPTAE